MPIPLTASIAENRLIKALEKVCLVWGGNHMCAQCDTIEAFEDMRTLSNGDIICEDCHESYYTCEACEDDVHSDYTHSHGDSIYCESCFMDRHTRCYSCREWIHNDDSFYHEGHGESFCESCYPGEDEPEDSNGKWSCIQSYGKKFQSIDRQTYNREKSLAMGIEIECESNGNWGDYEPPTFGNLLFKEDGSLNDGVEIVSQPMTLRYLRASPWSEERFQPMLKGLRRAGFTAWDANKDGHDVGLHIHIPKAFLTRFERVKLFRLVYENPSLFCAVSGRGKSIKKSGHYAEINGHKAIGACIEEDSLRKVVYKYAKGQTDGQTRYVALNFCNEHTIEFRLFRSSLVFERICADMEFVSACVDFVQSHGFSSMTGGKFLSYLAKPEQRKRYRNLAKLLLSKIQTDESL